MVSPENIFDRVQTAVQGAHERSVDWEVPDVVFHLTDVAGFVGIMTSNCLWASLATSLNDASEIQHGIGLAKEILVQKGGAATPYEKILLEFLIDPTAAPSALRIVQKPFVAAFCGSPLKSGQWLHYGRAGRGVALGFFRRISRSAEDHQLIKVDYDLESQRTHMEALIEAVKPVLEEVHRELSPAVAAHADTLAAGQVSFAIAALAATMKHHSFRDEDEYRLLDLRLFENGRVLGAAQPPPKVRPFGDTLVAYVEVPLGERVLQEVVLGHSAAASEEGVRMLLAEHRLTTVVSRSDVPVR